MKNFAYHVFIILVCFINIPLANAADLFSTGTDMQGVELPAGNNSNEQLQKEYQNQQQQQLLQEQRQYQLQQEQRQQQTFQDQLRQQEIDYQRQRQQQQLDYNRYYQQQKLEWQDWQQFKEEWIDNHN